MTGFERTNRFLRGEDVDHPPFHPIIMRWAARYAGVRYRDFCTISGEKCRAMIRCAEDFFKTAAAATGSGKLRYSES